MGQFDNNGQGGGAHTADYYAQYESTITNGEARIPICICVDTSTSQIRLGMGQYGLKMAKKSMA